jgi:hypothetical protein
MMASKGMTMLCLVSRGDPRKRGKKKGRRRKHEACALAIRQMHQ